MLPTVESWGEVRLRVAQFLANLWQGPCVLVHGTNAGASVPAALGQWLTPGSPDYTRVSAVPAAGRAGQGASVRAQYPGLSIT